MAGPDDKAEDPLPPLIQYPVDYTFKVIGLAADDFADHACKLVSRVVAGVDAERVTIRASAKGKYHSVSVRAWLVSEEQRRAVYQALWEDPRVVYYL